MAARTKVTAKVTKGRTKVTTTNQALVKRTGARLGKVASFKETGGLKKGY